MNGTEQKQRATAVSTLESEMVKALVEVEKQLGVLDARIHQKTEQVREAVNDERTWRIRQADNERAYVDHADEALSCSLIRFQLMTFWQRMNWLFRGVIS